MLLGQSTTITSVSAANYNQIVSPDSIVSGWGSNLAATTVVANVTEQGPSITLPASLGGVQLALNDSANASLTPSLYMVSPGQINYVIPSKAALGKAVVSVSHNGVTTQGSLLLSNLSPGIISADGSGTGVAAAQVLRVTSAGQASYESPLQSGSSTYVPRPIDLTSSPSDKVYIVLYGTGMRNHSLNPVIVKIGGIGVPVLYAGAQNQYPGLDQVNVGPLPQTLAGKGTVALTVTLDGVPSNPVQFAFR